MKMVATLTWLSFVVSCADSGESAPPAPTKAEQCVALREHLVELRLENVNVDREQHARAHREAMGQAFLSDCERDFGDDAVACGIAAGDAAAVSACLTPEVQP